MYSHSHPINDPPARRVGIFGTYGFGNMGDAAVADANIAGLQRHIPNMSVLGICQNPENVRERHSIEAVSIFRVYIDNSNIVFSAAKASTIPSEHSQPPSSKVKQWIKSKPWLYKGVKFSIEALRHIPTILKEAAFSIKIFRVVRQLDLMVMSGSGQINEEWGGPWRFPFGMFRWTLLARLAGCKVAFMSVGAGEINSRWTKFFCSSALKLANYVSVRDAETKKLIESWGVKNVLLIPDMAFSIRPVEKTFSLETSQKIVGINPIPYCDPRTWNIYDADVYKNFVKKWVEICNWLVSEDYVLYLIPNDLVMDNLVLDDIVNGLDTSFNLDRNVVRPTIDRYSEVIKGFSNCDYVITCRFHGLLFSFLCGKPAIAIAHHYKFFELAGEMGQRPFAFDITTFQAHEIITAFKTIKENEDRIKNEITDNSYPYKNKVEEQFKVISQLISG